MIEVIVLALTNATKLTSAQLLLVHNSIIDIRIDCNIKFVKKNAGDSNFDQMS